MANYSMSSLPKNPLDGYGVKYLSKKQKEQVETAKHELQSHLKATYGIDVTLKQSHDLLKGHSAEAKHRGKVIYFYMNARNSKPFIIRTSPAEKSKISSGKPAGKIFPGKMFN